MSSNTPSAPGITRERIGIFLGPIVFLAMLLLPAPSDLSPEAWRAAAVGSLMAIWWVTEGVPIPATALLPLVLFPPLGIMSIGDTAAPYGNPVIYLFMGGFMIALAFEKCGLHRRIALSVIGVVGSRPANLVGGFMLATALLSMWVSNTATTVMMLPVAMSLVHLVQREAGESGARDPNLPVALLLGVAYAASIGGVATLIGTPPNALLAGFMLEVYDIRIGFAEWMIFGVPIVVVSLPTAWIVLTRFVYPVQRDEIAGGAAMIQREKASLGPMSVAERRVAVITAVVALSWVFQPLLGRVVPGLSDTGIAIAGALALFLTPQNWRRGEFLLDWKQAERLPWAVLILYGGGLALAAAIQGTGLAEWIGGRMTALDALPVIVVAALIVTVIIFLTELTSNTATAATFLPVVASTAAALGADPALFAVPAAIAASCAFMLPVATPPNALVYASGEVSIPQMVRAGLWLNIVMIVLLTGAVFLAAPYILPGVR